jgi:uncharacterized coiled-coil protein SlyX
MNAAPATDFCTRIKRFIAMEKADIQQTERAISFAADELKRLNAAPHPDRERIKKVERHLAELQEHLAKVEESLKEDEEDRFQFCSPDHSQ